MRNRFKALLFAAFIDGSQNIQQLPSNWSVASKRDATEFNGEGVGGAVCGEVNKMTLQHAIRIVVDADMSVPLRGRSAGRRAPGSAFVGSREGVRPRRLSLLVVSEHDALR